MRRNIVRSGVLSARIGHVRGTVMNRMKVAEELLAVARLLAAEGDACGAQGCIRKVEGGRWGIMSGKTGKMWPSTYDSKAEAEDVLKRYHGRGF
jgi:hypothetical protein